MKKITNHSTNSNIGSAEAFIMNNAQQNTEAVENNPESQEKLLEVLQYIDLNDIGILDDIDTTGTTGKSKNKTKKPNTDNKKSGISGILSLSLENPELEAPRIKFDASDLSLALAQLQSKLSQTMSHGELEDIKVNREMLAATRDKVMSKITEQLEKKREADEKAKVSSILSWIATIFAVVFAAVMTVITAGGASGLLVGAIVGLAIQILDSTGAIAKITEFAAKQIEKQLIASGMPESEAKQKAMIAAVSIIQSLLIVVSIATIACGNKAGTVNCITRMVQLKASLAKAITSITSKLSMIFSKLSIQHPAQMAKMVLGDIISSIGKLARASTKAAKAGIAIQSGMQIATGAIQASVAVNQKESTEAQAQRMRLLQNQKLSELAITENGKHVEKFMNIEAEIFQQALKILKIQEQTNSTIVQSV